MIFIDILFLYNAHDTNKPRKGKRGGFMFSQILIIDYFNIDKLW